MNEFPKELIVKIGGGLVYMIYTGRTDLSGNDWAGIFAKAVGAHSLDSPLGIADVVMGRMAWSLKTVKTASFSRKTVRLISGRCSPDYSYGINDPHRDIQATGRAVLGIWNERVNIAYDEYNPVRTVILIRSRNLLDYCLFEEETHRYRTSDFVWEENKDGNLIGRRKETGEHCFTWQPHGSQFTIITPVPKKALRFQIQHPPILTQEAILSHLDFNASWVKILPSEDNISH